MKISHKKYIFDGQKSPRQTRSRNIRMKEFKKFARSAEPQQNSRVFTTKSIEKMRQQKVSKTETLYFDYPQNLKKGVSYLKVDHNPQPIEATQIKQPHHHHRQIVFKKKKSCMDRKHNNRQEKFKCLTLTICEKMKKMTKQIKEIFKQFQSFIQGIKSLFNIDGFTNLTSNLSNISDKLSKISSTQFIQDIEEEMRMKQWIQKKYERIGQSINSSSEKSSLSSIYYNPKIQNLKFRGYQNSFFKSKTCRNSEKKDFKFCKVEMYPDNASSQSKGLSDVDQRFNKLYLTLDSIKNIVNQ